MLRDERRFSSDCNGNFLGELCRLCWNARSRSQHGILLIVEQPLKFLLVSRNVPAADFIIIMSVDSSICKTSVLIALELEYRLVHQVVIEQSHREEQLEIHDVKIGDFLE